MTEPVKYSLEDDLGIITLDEPDRRNVLSFEMLDSLNEKLEKVAAEPSARVALIRANGSAFCAGMDLKTVALDKADQAARYADLLASAYRRLLTLPMPLFCAVDGPALGGAVGIALSADLVWMGPEARFAFPETRVGVVPAFVSVVARRRMTPGKLMGMALTGFTADATTAVRLSMAEFVSPNRASDDAEAYARRLMRDNSGRAMRRTKAYLQNQFSSTLEAELEAARAEFTAAAGSDAAREGLDMFRKKMPLVWGRKSGA